MIPAKIFVFLLALLLTGCISQASPKPKIASPTTEAIATRTPSLMPTATPTPTITLTPTPTATSTITLTPTPDIEAVIRSLVSEFNLNSEREYTIVSSEGRQYLVDTFNQAKMAKLEEGNWVNTTTEEKYGHLVPEGEKLRINFPGIKSVEIPDPSQGIYQRDIQEYDYMDFVAWSVGNMSYVKEYSEDLGQEVVNVYGTIVFPDHEGKLKEMNVKYTVVDPGYPPLTWVCNWNWNGDLESWYDSYEMFGDACEGKNIVRVIDTVEKFVEFHNKPGQMVVVGYVTDRPDDPPVVNKRNDWPTIYNRAAHYSWHRDKEFYQKFTDFIEEGGDIDISKDFVLAATDVSVVMTFEEMLQNYWEK
jgi:hypothetical protein